MTVGETAQRPAGALCRFFAEISHISLISVQHRVKSPVFVEMCRKMSNESGTVRQITVAFSGEKCYF
ncbi:MAG: hypothetical protein MSF41_08985 [Oscillibacter sp.]|nr:hypothetical protein [Oscillibacter sp.]